jgi:hypothetical protein
VPIPREEKAKKKKSDVACRRGDGGLTPADREQDFCSDFDMSRYKVSQVGRHDGDNARSYPACAVLCTERPTSSHCLHSQARRCPTHIIPASRCWPPHLFPTGTS